MRSKEGLGREKDCFNQVFAIKMIVKEYLGKQENLYAAFMDLGKAYDMADREALSTVLKIYGVGRQLLDRIKAFNREAGAIFNTC